MLMCAPKGKSGFTCRQTGSFMKLNLALLLATLIIASAAIAEDSEERTAPADQVPAACFDRDVNSTTSRCILGPDGSASNVPPRPLSALAKPNDEDRKPGPEATMPTEGVSGIKTDR